MNSTRAISKLGLTLVLIHTAAVTWLAVLVAVRSPEYVLAYWLFLILDFPASILEGLVLFVIGGYEGQLATNIAYAVTFVIIGGVWYYLLGRYLERRRMDRRNQVR